MYFTDTNEKRLVQNGFGFSLVEFSKFHLK